MYEIKKIPVVYNGNERDFSSTFKNKFKKNSSSFVWLYETILEFWRPRSPTVSFPDSTFPILPSICRKSFFAYHP